VIAPGARADLIFIDNEMELRAVFFNGNMEHQN